jgi:hypothetical protein
MRTTRLVAAFAGLLALAMCAADASAMYNPSTGTWLQRDPGPGGMMPAPRIGGGPAMGGSFLPRDQYADGMNLYQYVRSDPIGLSDAAGLGNKPDIAYINYLVKKYGLSEAGRRALHESLKPLKAAGGQVAKGAAEEAAEDIASLSGKFLKTGIKGGGAALGVFVIILVDASELDADDFPVQPGEDPSPKGDQKCIRCLVASYDMDITLTRWIVGDPTIETVYKWHPETAKDVGCMPRAECRKRYLKGAAMKREYGVGMSWYEAYYKMVEAQYWTGGLWTNWDDPDAEPCSASPK